MYSGSRFCTVLESGIHGSWTSLVATEPLPFCEFTPLRIENEGTQRSPSPLPPASEAARGVGLRGTRVRDKRPREAELALGTLRLGTLRETGTSNRSPRRGHLSLPRKARNVLTRFSIRARIAHLHGGAQP